MSDAEAGPAAPDLSITLAGIPAGTPAGTAPEPWARQWAGTPAAKVAMIVALLLIMQVPLLMVGGLIQAREQRQGEVLEAFRRGWGPEQTVGGPLLIVPYSWADSGYSGGRMHGLARLAASRLNVVTTLQPEERRRGLFHAIVYTATVELSGTITVPPLVIPDRPDVVVDWRGARIAVGVSDLRGMPVDATIAWNGGAVPLQAADRRGCDMIVLDAPAALEAEPVPDTNIPFKTALYLRGTQAFRIAPVARQIDMRVASPWPTPNFTGATLPTSYELRPNGFDAHWEMIGDASSVGWQLTSGCGVGGGAIWLQPDAQVGVILQEAVPTYLTIDRAAKYGVFFLTLSFLTMFLFETLARERIHLVQYGLVGLSVSLFSLLLISIAEPLGFTVAYAISAAAVMAQASLYMLSVVGKAYLAAVLAGVLGVLFGFLYVVLSLDTYALLAGTLALFLALSVLMFATRRVDWATARAAS